MKFLTIALVLSTMACIGTEARSLSARSKSPLSRFSAPLKRDVCLENWNLFSSILRDINKNTQALKTDPIILNSPTVTSAQLSEVQSSLDHINTLSGKKTNYLETAEEAELTDIRTASGAMAEDAERIFKATSESVESAGVLARRAKDLELVVQALYDGECGAVEYAPAAQAGH
ncbi:hypothetical protein BGZ91_009624 [Linnemannia elongata]|nr:hypothetical protein BGZ91_009624 [Linnemannia elongata]